jgi:electron transport complex protein RnfG
MRKYSFFYVAVCPAIVGLSLFLWVFCFAHPAAEPKSALKGVFPLADYFVPVESAGKIAYYRAQDKDKKLIGAVFQAEATGYVGKIIILAGMFKDGRINAIKILSQDETPGVGAQVQEPFFTGQFSRKKDFNKIQAIAGATVSSQAVIDAVEKKAREIEELIRNER